jgi:hypothetical protein
MHQTVKQPRESFFARSWLAVDDNVRAERSILQSLNDAQDASHVGMRVGHSPKRCNPGTEL